MNFPGDNTISLSGDAVKQILLHHFSGVLGSGVRITSVEKDGYYGSVALKLTFTTDEPPLMVPQRESKNCEPAPIAEGAPL